MKEKIKPLGNLLTVMLILIIVEILFGTLNDLLNSIIKIEISKSILLTISMIVSSIFIILYTKKTTGKNIKERIKKIDIPTIVIWLLYAKALMIVLMNISELILSKRISIENQTTLENTLYFIINAIIIGPIIEEIIFRYSSIELLREKYKSWTIIILLSILFTLFHSYNIQGRITILILGLALSIVYYYTKNILNTIIIHIIYNVIELIDTSKIVLFNSPIYYKKNGFIVYSTPCIIISLIIIVLSIIYIKKIFMKKYIKNV